MSNQTDGSLLLARAFLDVIEGKPSASPLSDGTTSARICLRAKQSAEELQFKQI